MASLYDNLWKQRKESFLSSLIVSSRDKLEPAICQALGHNAPVFQQPLSQEEQSEYEYYTEGTESRKLSTVKLSYVPSASKTPVPLSAKQQPKDITEQESDDEYESEVD